jgi:hypothetical protein
MEEFVIIQATAADVQVDILENFVRLVSKSLVL